MKLLLILLGEALASRERALMIEEIFERLRREDYLQVVVVGMAQLFL
jgi:hypothetical protein